MKNSLTLKDSFHQIFFWEKWVKNCVKNYVVFYFGKIGRCFCNWNERNAIRYFDVFAIFYVNWLDTRLDTSKKIQKNSCKRNDCNGTLLKQTQFSLLLHSLLFFYWFVYVFVIPAALKKDPKYFDFYIFRTNLRQ